MSNGNTRIKWIDYAKAIAMLMVIIGHVSSGNWLSDWIYSFHMPLFFFLSGVTMKASAEYKNYVKKLAFRLLVPYFLYSLCYFLYDALLVLVLHKNINLLHTFIGILIQVRGTPFSIGLWFLPLLFLSEIAINGVVRFDIKTQVIVVTAALLFGFAYAETIRQVLPWGMDVLPIAGFFIWMGYCVKLALINCESIYIFSRRSYLICIVAQLVNTICGRWNINLVGQSVDMHKMLYGNPLLYVMAALAGIIFMIALCQSMRNNQLSTVLDYIGKKTLHIYCLHGLVLAVVKKVREVIFDSDIIVSVTEQMLIAVFTCAVCVVIIWILETTIFGKISLYRKS